MMDVRKIKGSALVAAGVVLTMTACGPESSTTGNADVTTAAVAEADTTADAAPGTTGGDQKAENGQEKGQEETAVNISVNNDTVGLGTLAVFEPADGIEANSGVAIAGSDEEQLQQERIAGGAVGEVVSKDLEPLHGITDYTEGEYVTVYGVTEE